MEENWEDNHVLVRARLPGKEDFIYINKHGHYWKFPRKKWY